MGKKWSKKSQKLISSLISLSLLITVATGIFVATQDLIVEAVAGWTVDSLTYTTRRKLTIDQTKIDTADLTDFPVAVHLDNSNFVWTAGNADGFDLRFTQSNGSTLLKHERERHTVLNATNLVGHWKMNDNAASTTVVDSTGNNNGTATVNTSTMTLSGKINTALDFDLSNSEYMEMPDNASLSPGAGNFTINMWFKTSFDYSASGRMYSDTGSGSNQIYVLMQSSNETIATGWIDADGDNAGTATTSSLNDGAWHMLTTVRNGTTNSVYVDGVFENSATNAALGTVDVTGGSLAAIGKIASSVAQFFNGQIDDTRLYNTALSTDQVAAIYQKGTGTELATTGIAEYHVKIPTVSNTVNTDFYLYYRTTDTADYTGLASDVWDTNYKGVWHLSEETAGAAGGTVYYDSTTNNNDGADYVSAVGQDGKINGGQEFDGGDDYVDLGDPVTLDGFTSGMTISAWVKRGTTGATHSIVKKYAGGTPGQRSYSFYYTAADKLALAVSLDGESGTYHDIISTNTMTDNDWHYVSGWWQSGQNVKLYMDGVEWSGAITGSAIASIHSGTATAYIGNIFNGQIDEVTISSTARAAQWIKAAYNSGNNTLLTYGSEEPAQTPNAPTLVSPANGSATSDNTPTLSANYSDNDAGDVGTTNYRIASSSSADCSTDLVDSGTSAETSTNNEDTTWTPSSTIGIDRTYYWCAQNNDGVDTSSWTQMGNFVLDTTTPDIVAVDAGASSGDRTSLTSDTWFVYADTGSDDQVSFSWTDPSSGSDDTFYYELNASSGNTVTGDESNTTNAYIDSITIAEGANYFHVRPQNGASTWGTERTFIVKYDKTAPTSVSVSGIVADSTSQLTVTGTATDAGSSLHSTPYWFNETTGGAGATDSTDWQTSADFVDTGLSANTQYTYQVKAKDVAGNESSYSSASSAYTLATQVSSPASANATNKTSYSISLTWTNQSQTGMKIEQDTGCDGYETTEYDNASTNATSPRSISVSANTCYKFRISSYNGDGTLNTTSIPATTSLTTPPAQPTSLTHTANTTSSISWDWADVTDATGYKVYDSGDVLLQTIGTATSEWAQGSLATNTQQTVYVRATTTNGEGIASSTASAYTSANAPTSATHSANTTSSITWGWSSGGAQKEYYAWTTTPVDNSGWIVGTSWAESSLSANTQYTFEVKARNQDDDETTSVSASAYAAQNTPTAISFGAIAVDSIIVSASGSFPNLTSDSAGLYFLNTTNSNTPDWTQTNSWTNSSLSVNTQYTYRVKARNGDSDETAYTADSDKYTLANVPAAPTVSHPTKSSLKVTIDVNSNPTATEFAIHETTQDQYVQLDDTLGASTVWQTYTNWGGSSGAVVGGLAADTLYTFEVKARNGDNTETAFSVSASNTTGSGVTIPTAPTIGAPTALSSSSIRWNFTDNASDEDGFKLYSAGHSLISTNATANLEYIDETGLSENTAYSDRHIVAYNAAGESGDSADAAAIYTLANAPTNLTASVIASESITLSVDSLPNDTADSSGYYFTNTTASSNSGWIQTNSWQNTGLSCSNEYNYTVKYRNGDGDETGTIPLTASTNSCPSTPTIDNFNDGSTITDNTPTLQFDLSDPDAGDIINYQIQIDDNSDFSSLTVDYTEPSGNASPRNNVQYTPSALDDASYYWRVKAIDDDSAQSGWATANSGSIAFKVDTVSPVVSSVASTPSSTSTIITWSTTDENSSSQVEYGLTNSYGNSTTETDTSPRVSSHSVSLTGLTACTTYHYRVKSTDAVINQTTDSDNTFTTTGCAGGISSGTYIKPTGSFEILTEEYGITYSREVTLNFQSDSKTKKISISNTEDFENAILTELSSDASELSSVFSVWDICSTSGGMIKPVDCAFGSYIVYVKFYSEYGQASDVVSRNVEYQTEPEKTEEEIAPDVEQPTEPPEQEPTQPEIKPTEIPVDEQKPIVELPLIEEVEAPKVAEEIKPPVEEEEEEEEETILPELVEEIEEIIEKAPLVFKGLLKLPIKIIEKTTSFLTFKKPKLPLAKLSEPTLQEILLLSSDKWNLLSIDEIKKMLTSAMPEDIKILASKIPQFGEKLKKLITSKITKLTDIESIKLSLPTLLEKIGLSSDVPIAKLSLPVKEKPKAGVVQVKTAGNVKLHTAPITTKSGKSRQQITTISGQQIQLEIVPDQPVKAIKGYIVLRSGSLLNYPGYIDIKTSFKALFDFITTINPVQAQEIKKLVPSNVEGTKNLSRTAIREQKNKKLVPSNVEGTKNLSRTAILEQESETEIEERLVLLEFEYTDPDGDGIYTANIAMPVVEGEYEIITVMDYDDPELGMKEVRLVTVIDPEGYVYEKIKDRELRIPNVAVSLYQLDPTTSEYSLWPAKRYSQKNPQVTNLTGKYSFLVPEGTYYAKAETSGYATYIGEPFNVQEGDGVHFNIELEATYSLLKQIDWQTIILVLVIILLLYNFYRDNIFKKTKNLSRAMSREQKTCPEPSRRNKKTDTKDTIIAKPLKSDYQTGQELKQTEEKPKIKPTEKPPIEEDKDITFEGDDIYFRF